MRKTAFVRVLFEIFCKRIAMHTQCAILLSPLDKSKSQISIARTVKSRSSLDLFTLFFTMIPIKLFH